MSPFTEELTVAGRVAKGAAFLDEHDPGWWRADVPDAISLADLDLGDTSRCVLGQRCPLELLRDYLPAVRPGVRYFAYAAHLRRQAAVGGGGSPEAWGIAMGFVATGDLDREWSALTAAWRTVISGRRLEAAA